MFNFLMILSILGSVLLTLYSLKIYLKRKKYQHIPGPKTNGILEYFLGNYKDIFTTLKDGKIVPDQYLNWSKRFGSVFKFQVLNNYIVVITEPEGIREVLITKNFPKPNDVYKVTGYPFNTRFLGSGLVTEIDQSKWRHRRAIFNIGFNKSFLNNYLDQFNQKADLIMEKFRTLADNKIQVDLQSEMNRFSLSVILSVAFGLDIDLESSKLNYFIGKSLEGLNELFLDPFIMLKPGSYKKIKEYKNAIENLRKFARESVMDRLKQIENKEYISNDILTHVLNKIKDEKIDIELLIDDFVTFLNAGQETTANALTFCILELFRNRDVLEKINEEISKTIGERNYINLNDLASMEYIDCVFKETLRKYPPAVQFIRVTDSDITIKGYNIPIGSWITISPYVMGREEKYFKDSDKFLPERFLKNSPLSEEYKVKNYTYIPFSIGPRNCIGMNFAIIEAKILLIKFLKNFDFILDNSQSINVVERITLKPVDGCKCFLKSKF